jgi:hypothetical protein
MSAKRSLPQQDPTEQYPQEILTVIIRGKAINFWITKLSPRCFVLTSLKTGKTAQFHSAEAMWEFFGQLIDHLQHKTQPHTPALLPAPKVAGLLPPFAGAVQGQCKGWLNAHWAPEAIDGWVMTDGYCPYCSKRHAEAMADVMKQMQPEKENGMEIKKINAGYYSVSHNGGRIGEIRREYVRGHSSCAGTSKGGYEWLVDLDCEDGTKRFGRFEEALRFAQEYDPPRYWLSFANGDTAIVVDNGKRIGIAQKRSRYADRWALYYDESPDADPVWLDIFALELHVRNMNKAA